MAAPHPCLVHKNHTCKIFSLLPISPLSIYTSKHLNFPVITSKFFPKTSTKSLKFSSQPQYDVASLIPDDEEEPAIGDCLVFEEGIFDEPFLQNPQIFEIEETQANANSKITEIVPENLIPDNWLDVQKELNITKKERRKLREQLEYGRTVEKKRQGLMPIGSEVYERFKNEKLKELKPVVFDNPVVKVVERNDRVKEEKSGRVAPRNPRIAVYGGGLDDIAEFFSSESYDPKANDRSEGPRNKLFSKEEKILLNRRVPDLTIATSEKWNPLHTLAASGEFYLMNSLLKHNIDINTPDKDGLTAIHKAILGKKQAVFNFLLRESINPFVRDREGATLLHYAVYAASSQMIKILLLYNVDINLQDDDGWTPLHLAVQSRRTDIVRLLLIKGADKSLKNQDGLTPLELCLYSGKNTRTYELIRLIKRFS